MAAIFLIQIASFFRAIIVIATDAPHHTVKIIFEPSPTLLCAFTRFWLF